MKTEINTLENVAGGANDLSTYHNVLTVHLELTKQTEASVNRQNVMSMTQVENLN